MAELTVDEVFAMDFGRSLPELLALRSQEQQDEPYVAVGGDWVTRGELLDRSRRLASGLWGLGVRPGDRVGSIMGNRIESVELFFACAALGAINVPLNVFLKGEFLRYQLVDADPSVLVVDDAAREMAGELLTASGMSTTVVALDPTDEDLVPFASLFVEVDQQWPDPAPETIIAILYTSGTTGHPKGCVINHGYLLNWPRAHLSFGWFRPGDTTISTLPLYHGFGLSGLISTLAAGGRIRFEPSFSASTLMTRAKEVGANNLWAVGAIGAALLATPPSTSDTDHSLERCVFLPMSPAAVGQFEERFGVRVVCEGYGQTEVLPATMDGLRDGRVKPTSGRALPWLDVQVVDDDDQVLPTGQAGEITVRPLIPNSVFAGYWRNGEATVEAWRNLRHHTGDLGYFDEDGYLNFVDRKKDALRRRGENVSSVELETALLKHPGIAEVAVHAVPSELSEDEIKACLVMNAGSTFDLEEFFAFCKENLPYYAIPRYVEVIDALPANAVGRILKHKLREEWDTPTTVDLTERGLVVGRDERR